MEKNYLESKAGKKKSAKSAAWILVALALVFIYVVVKFAHTGIRLTTSGLPTDNEAYEVAKDFVKVTVRSSAVNFPGSGYGIAKKSDSVYVIKSTAEITGDSGDKKTTSFKLLMQYNGGKQDDMKSWSLLNISEEQ